MMDWQSVLYSVALAAPMPLVLLLASWWYHRRLRSRRSLALVWSAAALFIIDVPVLAVLLLMQPYENQPLFDLFMKLEFAAVVAGVLAGLVFALVLFGVLREAYHGSRLASGTETD